MNRKIPRLLLLSVVLGTTLSFAMPAMAQDAGSDTEIEARADAPKSRLVQRYATLAGSEAAATSLIDALRGGTDFTVTEQVTTTNADGTTTTNTVQRSIDNPAAAQGWGGVNITLSLAQALVDSGAYPDLQSALTGTTTTNADGTTTTTGGVLVMRADGMGWGAIAKELGFKLGELVSASNRSEKAAAAQDRRTTAKAERDAAKAERAANRAERPERAERPARAERPERPERPQRPERPERSGKP